MIIILVGESGSGKSSLARWAEKEIPSLERVVTYTTRPKRDGEKEGEDYHFINAETFNEMMKENRFVETAEYRQWLYGTSINFAENSDKIVVLSPNSARKLKKYIYKNYPDVKCIEIYIQVLRRQRLIWCLNRGDDIDEVIRRDATETGQFYGIYDDIDETIEQELYFYDMKLMCKRIEEILKR